MCVISIINQKGGVGKTTNTIHIGAHFANSGSKVLLLDFDPQCDLSHGVGVDVSEDLYDVVDFLNGEDGLTFEEVQKNMWLLPGNKYFVASLFKKNDLKQQLSALKGIFDYILIDCPPTTINHVDVVQGDLALLGSDYFLVPVEADEYPIKNLNVFLGSVFKLIEDNSLNLQFAGVFFSNVLVTKKSFEYYSSILKESGIGEYLFTHYIRQDSMVQKAVRKGKTIFDYSPNCRASIDFKGLGEELLTKIK
ncbi:MAG: ParA family protein [Flavobacteriales bacterium]|jgi:chromosome partitioning protein